MFEMIESLRETYLRAQKGIERRGLNEAIFKGFWVGEKEIRRYQYQEVYQTLLGYGGLNRSGLVDPRGFEPLTF